MNDSAFGELVAAGAQEGKDFGAVPFPGTGGSFLAVVDVFVGRDQGAERQERARVPGRHQRSGDAAGVQQGEGIGAGASRRRRVVAAAVPAGGLEGALGARRCCWSIAHGEAMSPEFQEGFYDAVSTYVRTRDADAFADDLQDAVSEDQIPQR